MNSLVRSHLTTEPDDEDIDERRRYYFSFKDTSYAIGKKQQNLQLLYFLVDNSVKVVY